MEQQGATSFFGEPSFDVEDFCKPEAERRGKRFESCRYSEPTAIVFYIYAFAFCRNLHDFSRRRRQRKTKISLFIDEAHLIFNEVSKALLSQIETMVKLIVQKE